MAPKIANAALSRVGSVEAASIRSFSSDFYSLGVTLWSALAAVVMTIDPFHSPTIYGVLAAISAVATARGDREFGE
jgi:hypothetical protein